MAAGHEVVVHCMLSKQRGPTCASKLLERIKDLGVDLGADLNLVVMEGGINGFMEKFKDDKAVAELPKGKWEVADH